MSEQNVLDFHFHKDNSHHHRHNSSGSAFLDPYSASLQFNYAISPTFPTAAVDSRKPHSTLPNHTITPSTTSINSTAEAVATAAAATQTTYDRPFYLPPINATSNEHENILPFISLLKQQQWKDDSLSQIIDMKPSDITSASINSDHQSTISSTEDMPTHIVSPEAIREAQKEETEEALGQSQSMPFSAFPSFTSLKQRLSVQFSPPTATKKFNIPFSPTVTKNDPYYVNEDGEDDDEEEEEESLPKTPQIVNELVVEKENTSHRSQEKLKRPPNAYLLFNRDMRRKLLKQSPKMTVAEISKVVGDWWKALPDDQRQYYVKEASLLKEEHLKKYPDFIYTRRSKAELAEAKKLSKLNKRTRDESELGIDSNMYNNSDDEDDDRKLTKRRNTRKSNSLLNNGQRDPRGRKKKRHKHPYAPKHPMSAYLYYLAEVYPQVSQNFPGSTVGPISKSISRTWHAMPVQERLPWVQKAESDKARYAREMQVYMASNKNNSSSTSPTPATTTNNSNLEHLSEKPTNHKVSDDDDDDNGTIDDGFRVEEKDGLDLHALANPVKTGNSTAAV